MSIEVTVGDLREGNRPILNPDGTVTLESIDFSSVDMYFRCPEQWRRRYILGERKPPGVALIEGTSHHAAMESDNNEKLKKGKVLKPAQMTDIFVTRFAEETQKAEKTHEELKLKMEWEEGGEPVTADAIIERAKKLHVDYAAKIQKKIEPVCVEDTFSHDVANRGFRIHGQIDVESKAVVYDYKTSAKAKSQSELDNNLQLTLYSWVKRKSKVAWVGLIKTKEPYVQFLESTRNPGHWGWGVEVVASAVDGIRKGSFPKTNPGAFPPPWWCSSRFCGYFASCRGKYHAEA